MFWKLLLFLWNVTYVKERTSNQPQYIFFLLHSTGHTTRDVVKTDIYDDVQDVEEEERCYHFIKRDEFEMKREEVSYILGAIMFKEA